MTDFIADFFNNALELKIDKHLKSKLINSKYKLKSNVLFLTSSCNLNCEYCYQLDDRMSLDKQVFISEEDVNIFFTDLLKREPNKDSTVVIFGGEPFLNPKIVFYILNLTDKITELYNKKFNLSLTTNGIYFLDKSKLISFVKRIKNCKNHFTLEISYDGAGHNRRIYKNGESSKKDVETVLEYFNKIEQPISIRYTIHKDNYQHALKDLILLSTKSNYKKIIVNFYEQELEKYIDVQEFKNKLMRQACEIFRRTNKPICHLNCGECLGCNFEEFKGIHYQFDKKAFDISKNADKFDYFSKIQKDTGGKND